MNNPSSILHEIYSHFVAWYHFHKYEKRFRNFGDNTFINKPLRINHPENISLGHHVRIGNQTWLAATPLAGEINCELIFKDGAMIGDYNHIYATGKIVIEENALTANFVYISDNLHSYEDIDTPITKQPIKQLRPVVIGEGSWLGEHVCVIGASVGKHCVIGANSVVTHDIPDYCVAVGSPAHIIKRYNSKTHLWEKTDENGCFL